MGKVHALVLVHERITVLGRKKPIEKIASFLQEVASRQERWGRPASPVSLSMPHADIADYLRLTIETVSRSFTRLKNARVIALPEPSSVELLDRARLDDIASGF